MVFTFLAVTQFRAAQAATRPLELSSGAHPPARRNPPAISKARWALACLRRSAVGVNYRVGDTTLANNRSSIVPPFTSTAAPELRIDGGTWISDDTRRSSSCDSGACNCSGRGNDSKNGHAL